MNPEQDCTSIRRQAIIMFCHDFGSISGSLSGYSDILNRIANKEPSLDDINLPELLQKLQGGEQHSASRFISMTGYFTSNLEGCETELSDIIEQIQTAYQDDFKAWYINLKKLELHYLETYELDTKLTKLLLHHANNFAKFRLSLRDEAIKF